MRFRRGGQNDRCWPLTACRNSDRSSVKVVNEERWCIGPTSSLTFSLLIGGTQFERRWLIQIRLQL